MIKQQKKNKVSLKHDLTFKSFFKSNNQALKSLLQAFLPLPKGKHIQEVHVLDSLIPSMEKDTKNPVMDLRLKLGSKEIVNVEMQMCPHARFTERVLFYWAKNYTSQLKEGYKYHQLYPVYSLLFCNFNRFPNTKGFYSSFSIRSDEEPYFKLNPHLQMVFVELTKFKIDDIKSLVDTREAWCYLLKWFEDMGERDRQLFAEQSQDMEELMDWTRPLSLEEQEKVLAEAREKNWRDRMAREDYVFQEGIEKGMEKGMQAVALNMLKKSADMAFISEVTGLSVNEINNLKNGSY